MFNINTDSFYEYGSEIIPQTLPPFECVFD